MIVSNCPRCNEAVRVPSGALPEDAFAKCPWCHDTFSLADVLSLLPPVLEVLSADGQPIGATQREAVVGSETGAFGGDPQFGDIVANDSAAAETVDEGWGQDQSDFKLEDPTDTWKAESASGSIAPMRMAPPRKKKSKFAGIRMALGVILGGALAFPIADGLLVLMGRPSLGVWSSILGEKNESSERSAVAAALPADVVENPTTRPTKPSGRMLSLDAFDPGFAADDSADSAVEQLVQPNAEEPTVADASDVETSDQSQTSETQIADVNDVGDDNVAAAGQTPGLVMPATTADEESPASLDPIQSSAGQDTEGRPDASTNVTHESSAENIESPDLATISDPQPRATADEPVELVKMAEKAAKMVDAVANFDGDAKERGRRMLLTYEQIAIACNLATSDSEALNTLASKIKNSTLLDEIGDAASQWLIYSSRKSEGIVLVGQANSGSQGQSITLDSGTVLSVAGDLQLSATERVLAMGRIIGEKSVELVLTQPLP